MPDMQFPPFALIMFVSSAISTGLGIYGLIKGRNRVFLYFGLAFVLVGLWPLFYGIQLILAEEQHIRMIAKLTPVTMQFAPIFIFICTSLLIKQEMPPRWILAVMALFASVSAFTMVTNDILHLGWDRQELIRTPEGFSFIMLIPSVWMQFIVSTYHFGVGGYILIMAYKGMMTHKQPYRTQFQLVFVAMAAVMITAALYTYRLVSFGPYNPVPASFAMASIIIAIAIFRYRFLNIIPYARESVFEAIDNPAVITDGKGTLLEFNTAAMKFFRLSSSAVGQSVEEVFMQINMDWNILKKNESVTMETKWGTGTNHIFSALKKTVSKGDLEGYLVIFTDITTQMDAMQTAHEKEIVTYKESLLGDMHDGIGGVVATAAMVAQSALEETDVDIKNKKIRQIANLLENGSFELRSMLNILDKETIDWNSLISDMRSFSSTVLDSKDIKRRFITDGSVYSHQIDFDKYLSIFRLFKEIITNIIKHSEADSVEISIIFEENSFRIKVCDNGVGIGESESKGYGLKNMQRRTEKLSGTLEINSENGTTINIIIPV